MGLPWFPAEKENPLSAPLPTHATAAPLLGKISPEMFTRVIAPHLGAERAEVIAGPRAGHDAAVIRIGAGRVMAVTTDPLSVIPSLGPRDPPGSRAT